jgi:DNA polymerase-3 subunit alpha
MYNFYFKVITKPTKREFVFQGGLLDDARRVKRFNDAQYLKSADEMAALFSDFPQLLSNTVEVAKRCNLHFELFKKNYLPLFPTPEGMSIAEFFEQESKQGLAERLKGKGVDEKVYADRLQFELSVILEMDFPGYFLIVSDFIRWAKDIPSGVGKRGR